jgi:hypothetical protein
MHIHFNKLLKSIVSQIVKAKKILWILGSDAVLAVLLIVILEAAFGEFLFYKYGFLIEKQNPVIGNNYFQFKENIYMYIPEKWQERNEKFENYSQKDYLSPF